MPNVYPAQLKRRSDHRAKIVHSPRGMLAAPAMKISAWKKRPFWWLQQRPALEAADCIHATAMSEFEEIRAAGLTNPVAIIPNGIDVPRLTTAAEKPEGDHVVLSLGRVHPKKGLARLIRAWARIEPAFPSWRLRIVGPPEAGHDRELGSLARTLGAQRITIEGPIYEADEKLGAYRGACLFVLPTLNENFALTVAEALAAAVPVIATKGAPWAGLERERCGWWIDHGVEPLVVALRHAMTIGSAERQALGLRGRSWMERDFGWDKIAGDMLDVYDWIRSGGPPPAIVRIDG
jgi:glycosyltransferase involved in cell wall biosynthesis